MAVFERETQKIVLRIVYDGPARAGKTTNVEQLCEMFSLRRRTELWVPEQIAGRTLFFDWMQLDGGLVAGHQLSCQIVSVPGQRRLLQRRRQILQTADVVVFVCSSARGALERSRASLESLRAGLHDAGRAHVPVVVQANKQDLKSAVDPSTVREALGLDGATQVMTACARDGLGVRETAVIAIRAGARQVGQELMERGIDELAGRAGTAQELLTQLRELDGGALAMQPTVEELFDEEEDDEGDGDDAAGDGGDVATEQVPQDPAPGRQAQRAQGPMDAHDPRSVAPPRPDASVSHGCVWPSATGRQVLERLRAHRWELMGRDAGDAGTRAATLFKAGNWCVRTSPRRRFASLDAGRAALIVAARRKIQLGDLLPPRNVLTLQVGSDGSAWLWSVAPWMRTLEQELLCARQPGAQEVLYEVLGRYARAVAQSAQLTARSRLVLDPHPAHFAWVDEQVFYLGNRVEDGESSPMLGAHSLRFVEQLSGDAVAVERYLDALQRELCALPPQTIAALDLVGAFESAPPGRPGAEAAHARLVQALSRVAAAATT